MDNHQSNKNPNRTMATRLKSDRLPKQYTSKASGNQNLKQSKSVVRGRREVFRFFPRNANSIQDEHYRPPNSNHGKENCGTGASTKDIPPPKLPEANTFSVYANSVECCVFGTASRHSDALQRQSDQPERLYSLFSADFLGFFSEETLGVVPAGHRYHRLYSEPKKGATPDIARPICE